MRLITGLLLLALSATGLQASVKVIYGEDNRVDVYASTNPDFVELSKSTAAMIPNSSLKTGWGSKKTTINSVTLERRGMCSSERFSDQVTAANCSGFLVGEDLLVTAGHCIKSMRDCGKVSWVFDYKMESENTMNLEVAKDSLYKCTKIIDQKLSSGDDYALVQLDRKVVGRTPLKFRSQGTVSEGEDLVVIGHPTGLPTKIADGARVKSVSTKHFSANLDTYGGNSGSAVFNVRTLEVEGILVRGATDYVRRGGCQVSNEIGDDSGNGEDVSHITRIKALLTK